MFWLVVYLRCCGLLLIDDALGLPVVLVSTWWYIGRCFRFAVIVGLGLIDLVWSVYNVDLR